MTTRQRLIVPVFFILGSCSLVTAQNAAPYWSTSGNSNATTSSKFGTITKYPFADIDQQPRAYAH